MLNANRQIVEVINGKAGISDIASPYSAHCMHCLFRPACRAYWLTRKKEPLLKWPADVKGSITGISRLRNGRLCMRITQDEPLTPSCVTVRNLSDDKGRHPLLPEIKLGTMVAIYCLVHQFRSDDYIETHDTVVFLFAEGS